MYYVYVLYSKKYKRLYKGFTKDLESRLKQHNNRSVKSTKAYIPWEIVYLEEFKELDEAVKRERYFKTAAGRRFLKEKL